MARPDDLGCMVMEDLAGLMLAECAADGQSARRVDPVADADPLRAAIRRAARERGLHIRTALMDDVVVVARTDATLWSDDTATMRRKLTPPS